MPINAVEARGFHLPPQLSRPISSDGDIRPAFPLSRCARKIVRLDWDTSIAQRVIWIDLLFPSAFFLSAACRRRVTAL
jgi:hypothetical protein